MLSGSHISYRFRQLEAIKEMDGDALCGVWYRIAGYLCIPSLPARHSSIVRLSVSEERKFTEVFWLFKCLISLEEILYESFRLTILSFFV